MIHAQTQAPFQRWALSKQATWHDCICLPVCASRMHGARGTDPKGIRSDCCLRWGSEPPHISVFVGASKIWNTS